MSPEPPVAGPPADVRFWDRFARRYAGMRIPDPAGYERTLERTRGLLGPDAVVLELGCGTGTTALRLAPGVRRYLGTDVSARMVGIARERAVGQGCTNASFEVAAADRAPGPDGAFDAVLAFNLLHLLRDRAAVLARVRALLAPGGLFVSKTPCLAEATPLLRVAVPALRAVGLAPWVAFLDADTLRREIEAAGFEVVETARHGSGRRDPRRFVVARKAGRAPA